ncbi:MAG TPA: hypothetical protein VFW12_10270 [Candidatus Limnocylindria bacterium]|nr:hypothetical protein [Candidatus Limnocylindria bacterium]
MDDLLRIVVQWLHVLSGVLWIGGGYYTIFVQLPALAAMPMPARGPALMELGPRQVRYILRVAELTLLTGVGNLLLSGRARQLEEPFGSRWAMVMLVGIVLAIVLYGLVRGMTKPLVERLLRVAPQAAAGDQAAAQQVPVLRERIRRLGLIQISIGAVILFAMVMARFS